VILVGRQKYVRRVLDDDGRFALSDMDRRMRQICGGERLMLGMPSGDPERDLRMRRGVTRRISMPDRARLRLRSGPCRA